YAYAFSGLALAYFAQAEHELESERSFDAFIKPASENIQKALEMNPDYDEPHLIQGYTAILIARSEVRRRISPVSNFATAQKAFEQAWKLNPGDSQVARAFAELHRWKAEWFIAAGRNPKQEIQLGMAWIEKALAISDMPELLAIEGTLYLLQARSDRSRQSAQKAVDSLRRALQINPNLTRKYGVYLDEALILTR
ncbi:MAG TPA: hypothetical protein VJ521_14300, partial [Acidobacteriota bacterium]|nr:hypothetical protein [Acidobacteriota bacterium]